MNVTKLEMMQKVMEGKMIENYETHGHLVPVIAFISVDFETRIIPIPKEALEDARGKSVLVDMIKDACKEPEIAAAAIILEAYAKRVSSTEDEMAKLILSGNIRVRECKEKDDVLMFLFSTPNKEEMVTYFVDDKKKLVLGKVPGDQTGDIGGIFSNLFEKRKG